MTRIKAAAVTAVLALSLCAAGPGLAGGKNGGGDNGGGKNGGGDHGGKNGGGGGGGGNGGNNNNGGGNGGVFVKRVVVCVINHQVFRVARVEDCGQRAVVRYRIKRHARTIRYDVPRLPYYAQPGVAKNGGGYGYGGDYVIGGGYLGSPAAVAQWRRRAAARLQFSGGYVGGGSVGGGGYYSEGEQSVVIKHHRHRKHRKLVYYGYPAPDSGVIIHYGPAIVKGGGY